MKRIKVPEAKELASGSWRCRVMYKGKAISRVADTKEQAEELARQAVAAAAIGMEKEKEKAATLGSCIDRYIADREAVLSPSTIRGYQIVRDNRFQNLMSKDIHSLTQQQLQAAVNYEAKQVAPKTLRNAWGLLSATIKAETGTIPSVRLPAVAKNQRPWLDDQQVKLFLELIRDTNVEVACLLALHSLRCSELLAVSWGQIDTKRKTITVKGAMVPGEKHRLVQRDQNKTKASQREIPIIIPRLLELAEGKPAADPAVTIESSWLRRCINAICEDNGLPKVGIHGLRHTFASICYYAGIPEKAVMEMGGWSEPTVLREIYTHISARQRSNYVEKLTGFFDTKP